MALDLTCYSLAQKPLERELFLVTSTQVLFPRRTLDGSRKELFPALKALLTEKTMATHSSTEPDTAEAT